MQYFDLSIDRVKSTIRQTCRQKKKNSNIVFYKYSDKYRDYKYILDKNNVFFSFSAYVAHEGYEC